MERQHTIAAPFDILKVASFNLRRDFGLSRKNRWADRRQYAAQVIRRSEAAIVGVQELLPAMRNDVRVMLQDYSIFGWGRKQSELDPDNEHSDIIIRNDKAEVSFCKTFWLSKHPERVSRAYFALFPRICTVVEVTLKDSGRRIRVFNTHFDHVCWLARTLGVRVILRYMAEFDRREHLPTVLMGDMNASYHSHAIRLLRENLHDYPNIHLTDVYSKLDTHDLFNTYHGFHGRKRPGHSPIDYIFVSDEFEVLSSHIEVSSFDGQYPSDHFPLVATLRLRDLSELG